MVSGFSTSWTVAVESMLPLKPALRINVVPRRARRLKLAAQRCGPYHVRMKVTVSLSLRSELLARAGEMELDLSLLLEAALERTIL